MIDVTIEQAARARGVENPKQLADRMDCAPAIVWKVWTRRCMPQLPMLDRICEALGCELSELIVRVPKRKRGGHQEKPDGNGHTSTLPQKRSSGKKVPPKTKAAKLSRTKRSR